MKEKQTFFEFCNEYRKNSDRYEKIAERIETQNKEEMLKNKEESILKLNESIKNQNCYKNITSSVGNVLTLSSLSLTTYISIDNIIISKNHEAVEITPIIQEYSWIFLIVGFAIIFHAIILFLLYRENRNIEFYKNIIDLIDTNNEK